MQILKKGLKRQLEKAIDKKIVDYARERGWVVIKLTAAGRYGTSGYPDRLFIGFGRVFFMEMKATGEECTELQLERHKELRQAGATVYVCDNVFAGRGIVDLEFQRANGRRRHPFQPLPNALR
jgi:hypothetical protein